MQQVPTEIVPLYPGHRVFRTNLFLLEVQERERDPYSRLSALLAEARRMHEQIWGDSEGSYG